MEDEDEHDDAGVLSPEMRAMVARLETEMDNAEKDFLGSSHKSNNNMHLDVSTSSEEDDVDANAAAAAIAIRKSMKEEETDMHAFIKSQTPPPALTPRQSFRRNNNISRTPQVNFPPEIQLQPTTTVKKLAMKSPSISESFVTVDLTPPLQIPISDTEKGLIGDETVQPDASQQHPTPSQTSRMTCLSKHIGSCIMFICGIIFATLNYFKSGINYHLSVVQSAPEAYKHAITWAASTEKGILLSFVSLLLAMFSTVYPTSPSYNIYMAMLLILFQIKPVAWQKTTMFLILTMMLSICIDIDWLDYKYFPTPLIEEDALAYRIQQEGSVVYAIVWYCILFNIFVKLLCLNEALKYSTQGRNIRGQLCDRFGRFFISTSIPDDLAAAVKDKVIAQVWVEFICSLIFLACFLAILFDGITSRLFSDVPNQLLSLQGLLLIKCVSGLFVALSMVHHISMKDVVGVFACHSIPPASSREGKRVLSSIGKSWCIPTTIKVLDFSVGVLLWISLVSVSHKMGLTDSPKNMKCFLSTVYCTLILTTIVSMIYSLVVVLYMNRLSNRKRFVRRRPRRETTPRHDNHNIRSRRNHKSRHSLQQNSILAEDYSYDLERPRHTQSALESRLSGASTRPRSAPMHPAEDLDMATCTPPEFQAMWSRMAKGLTLTHDIQVIPTLSDIHQHFHARKFHVVASGKKDSGTTKVYIIAKRRSVPSQCLVYLCARKHELNAEVRCTNQADVRYFLNALGLADLVG